jgi:hypothetical protein
MIYRDAKEEARDPKAYVHHHAITTATGTLRNHLGKSHREEYDRKCAESGWKNHLAEADKQKAAKDKVAMQVAKKEAFSMDGLLNCIVKFIVADDQVYYFRVFKLFLLMFYLHSLFELWNVPNSVNSWSSPVQI